MEKINQLLENYRISLLEWNDAIRTKKKISEKYNEQKLALEQLQDHILDQSKDKRYWKRGNESI